MSKSGAAASSGSGNMGLKGVIAGKVQRCGYNFVKDRPIFVFVFFSLSLFRSSGLGGLRQQLGFNSSEILAVLTKESRDMRAFFLRKLLCICGSYGKKCLWG